MSIITSAKCMRDGVGVAVLIIVHITRIARLKLERNLKLSKRQLLPIANERADMTQLLHEIIQATNTLHWPGAILLIVLVIVGAWVIVKFIETFFG